MGLVYEHLLWRAASLLSPCGLWASIYGHQAIVRAISALIRLWNEVYSPPFVTNPCLPFSAFLPINLCVPPALPSAPWHCPHLNFFFAHTIFFSSLYLLKSYGSFKVCEPIRVGFSCIKKKSATLIEQNRD